MQISNGMEWNGIGSPNRYMWLSNCFRLWWNTVLIKKLRYKYARQLDIFITKDHAVSIGSVLEGKEILNNRERNVDKYTFIQTGGTPFGSIPTIQMINQYAKTTGSAKTESPQLFILNELCSLETFWWNDKFHYASMKRYNRVNFIIWKKYMNWFWKCPKKIIYKSYCWKVKYQCLA